MSETAVAVPPAARQGLVTPEDRERWLADRAARRGSDVACNIARQDALDRLNAAIDHWARYCDDAGNGPSQAPAKYFMTFKRMVYSALGIDQALKPEQLGRVEQLGLMTLFDSVAMVLQDGMAHRVPRAKIKMRYRSIINDIGAVHNRMIKLAREGYSSEEGDQ